MAKGKGTKKVILEYLQILVGATLVGLSYNIFILPAELAAGGISGVSTIVYTAYGIQPAYIQFLINMPIFIFGWITLGRDFSGKSLAGTFWVPFIIWLSTDAIFTITNPLLSAIYGGIMLGVGMGIVYRVNGSTGGTAALAQILKKFTGLSSGYAQLIIDGVVVSASLIVFDLETTLFALICIFITSKAIDFVQLRTSDSTLILIITEDEARIQKLIHEGIDRGLTKVRSIGGYSNIDRTMILCVAEQSEAVYIKKVLQKEEPKSFVIFINTSDILGRGFSVSKYYGQKF